MHYLIGDLQGCCDALERLLARLDFSPSRDHLYALGDLVNRGPASRDVLQRLAGLGASASCLLGNHDLHLLAAAAGVRRPSRKDTLQSVLDAPDRDHWLHWLRHQRLALQAQGWLMVHAGVVPQWDAATTLALAAEVEQMLQGPDLADFLPRMYGNQPARWDPALSGPDRLRFTINVLTRIRYCTADGELEFGSSEGPGQAPAGYLPWFEVPGRATTGTPVAFGHWSTLGLINRPDLLATDTGCVWGGRLTAVRIDGGRREVIQVECEQAQAPGS
jgi:bis(5'-nucleosyl)-tetraphosphatase (symmetrical)